MLDVLMLTFDVDVQEERGGWRNSGQWIVDRSAADNRAIMSARGAIITEGGRVCSSCVSGFPLTRPDPRIPEAV